MHRTLDAHLSRTSMIERSYCTLPTVLHVRVHVHVHEHVMCLRFHRVTRVRVRMYLV